MTRLTAVLLASTCLAACASDPETGPPTVFLAPDLPVAAAPAPAPEPPSDPRPLVTAPEPRRNVRVATPRTVNAVTVFPYYDDRIYPVATSPGFFTSILLEPGEDMPGKAAIGDPDPAKWRVDKTQFGTPHGPVVALLVKPGEAGLHTNMFIATSRRQYQLSLISYAKPAMDQVRWTGYPEDSRERTTQIMPVAAPLDPTAFDFGYRITLTDGERPTWMPLRAFDTGVKRYIEFPAHLGQVSAPALFLVQSDGTETPVPVRPRGRYYEIDARFNAATLRLGNAVVEITKEPAS